MRIFVMLLVIFAGGCCCCPIAAEHQREIQRELEMERAELQRLEDAKLRIIVDGAPVGLPGEVDSQTVLAELDQRIALRKSRIEQLEQQANGSSMGGWLQSDKPD